MLDTDFEEAKLALYNTKLYIVQETKKEREFIKNNIDKEKITTFTLSAIQDAVEKWGLFHEIDSYLNWLGEYMNQQKERRG